MAKFRIAKIYVKPGKKRYYVHSPKRRKKSK